MKLYGSCHCRSVTFTLNSKHPYPYNICYCSICRKTAGSGGYAINLGGAFGTLEVTGSENVTVYRAKITNPDTGEIEESLAERSFCKHCGSALWAWDPRWPDLVHPQASAIDTPLPTPPEHTHLMLGSVAPWVRPNIQGGDKTFDEYPSESIADWHKRLGLEK
jgi:hypothetical protein